MLVKNQWVVNAVFLMATLSLVDCGQNANIAKKPGNSSAGQADSLKANIQEDGVLPVPLGAPAAKSSASGAPTGAGIPTTAGAPVVSGAPSNANGSTTISSPSKSNAPVSAVPAAPSAPAANNPATKSPATSTQAANSNGNNPGKSAQIPPAQAVELPAVGSIERIGNLSAPAVDTDPRAARPGCATMVMPPFNILAQPMSKKDVKIEELPYQTTKGSSGHNIATLEMGQASKNKFAQGRAYVEDSQVLFKFPVRLPPREAISKFYGASIQLSLLKISGDHHPKTEVMCFIDQRLCSGMVYDEKNWQANINKKFWGNSKPKDLNDFFVKQFISADNQADVVNGMDVWTNSAFTFKISDLIQGSKYKDELSFLYEGVKPGMPLEKDIRVVVADDIRVNSPTTMVIEYEENTCETYDLQLKATAAAVKSAAAEIKKNAAGK